MEMLDVYRVEILGEVLRWTGPDGRLLDERPLAGVDTLVAEVEFALGDLTRKADLQAAGRMLYRWLDGERGWLQKVLELRRGFTLQIDVGQRLRHLPWELSCDEGPFLVNLVGQPFHPVRRVSARRPEPQACANRPLRILFAACSPENVHPVLAFEEEEIQILTATQGHDIELVVEESGSLKGLKSRLVEYGAGYFDVLHLSGHALVDRDQPVFLMEDWLGQRQDVTAEQMAEALEIWPRLVFLSGCETGRAPDRGHLPSFCECLVEAGAPLVLGWSEPVGDRHAIEAATVLYGQLAIGASLDHAITLTRLFLLDAKSPYWSLLRSYGDDSPLAPLVTPIVNEGRARLLPRPLHRQFIDAGAQMQVCAPESFVGRRRALQRCLRSLVEKQNKIERYHEGLLLTGMGGLGKSSLALRLCGRLHDHKLLVWVGRYDELSILDRLNHALDLPGQEELLFQPGISLFQRLCSLFAQLKQPLVLVFDDFEQNGEKNPAGQPCFDEQGCLRVCQEAQEILRDLLEAIHKTTSSSRIIITCRYAIPPPSLKAKLHIEPLDHFRGADLIKKLQRLPGFMLEDRTDLAARARRLADGNPRLLETFDALLNQLPAAQIDPLLSQLEAAAASFREHTLLAGLLALLDPSTRLLLATLNLCHLPVPATTITTLADEATRTRGVDRAASLGLVERIGSEPATLYVSHLLEPLLAQLLDDGARQRCQGELADQLARYWWLEQEGIVWEQALELRRLALAAGQAQRVGEITATLANRLNYMSRYYQACALCEEALSLAAESSVLSELGNAERMLGQTLAARSHLEAAVALGRSSTDKDHQRARPRALYALASLLSEQGEVERSLTLWQESLALADQSCDVLGKAATLHQMAGVIAQRGEFERALALWQESLALQEQIGDFQGKAANLHQMARVIAQRGEVERALALWYESLALEEQTGNVQGKAATLHEMAGVIAQLGEIERGLALWQESLALKEQIGNLLGMAVTLHEMAGVFAQRGEVERALALWHESLALSEQIGDVKGKAATLHQMACVIAQRDEVECALALWQESLALSEQVGAVKSKAATLNQMAGVIAQRGEVERALVLWQESLALREQFGDVKGKAVTLNQMAGVIAQRGEVERALALWQESLALFEQIGNVQGKAAILHNMAGVIAQRGEVERALALWQESLALFEQIGNVQGKAAILHYMAGVIAQRGEVERALALWQESLALLEQVGDVKGKAETLAQMAWAATLQGKSAEVRLLYLQAVQTVAVVNAWPDVLKGLCNLGIQKDALALQQALWVMIRTQAPLEDSLALLSFTFAQKGNDPRLPPLLVATALHLVQVRDQNHARLNDFRQTAADMLIQLLPADKHSQEGIQEWLAQLDHHDPRLFLPRLNEVLEELIGDGWYFDRSPLLARG